MADWIMFIVQMEYVTPRGNVTGRMDLYYCAYMKMPLFDILS
jgi:hypothetical protein